jgi:hypothetical protein
MPKTYLFLNEKLLPRANFSFFISARIAYPCISALVCHFGMTSFSAQLNRTVSLRHAELDSFCSLAFRTDAQNAKEPFLDLSVT